MCMYMISNVDSYIHTNICIYIQHSYSNDTFTVYTKMKMHVKTHNKDSRCSISLCLYTWSFTPPPRCMSRTPSMIEAWLKASEKMAISGSRPHSIFWPRSGVVEAGWVGWVGWGGGWEGWAEARAVMAARLAEKPVGQRRHSCEQSNDKMENK